MAKKFESYEDAEQHLHQDAVKHFPAVLLMELINGPKWPSTGFLDELIETVAGSDAMLRNIVRDAALLCYGQISELTFITGVKSMINDAIIDTAQRHADARLHAGDFSNEAYDLLYNGESDD